MKCYGEYKSKTGLGRKVKKTEENERAVLMRLEDIARKAKNGSNTWEVINRTELEQKKGKKE